MSEPKRHAVLLIHGIGEQRPLSTLRAFVTSLLVGKNFRSKPDNVSRSFELRRLTYDETKNGQKYQTCFFECYWAYRFRDTNLRHIIEWGRRLVFTHPHNVPLRLWWIWLLFWIATISILGISIYPTSQIGILAIPESIGKIKLLVFPILAYLLSSVFLYQLGDAARYLDSLPANILERQAIRTQGVNLLRKLHSAKNKDGKSKYDRIIVIGHSLGSVIGYDILKFYWADVNKKIFIDDEAEADRKIEALEKFLKEAWAFWYKWKIQNNQALKAENFNLWLISLACYLSQLSSEVYQKAQEALINANPSKKTNSSNQPWRITDFVTIGSPLTYADFLIATSKKDLNDLKTQRELPTCPPQLDKGTHCYWYEYGKKNRVLHHAAHFALTKWTNLYFPEDPVAGKVGHLFGQGVLDIPCKFEEESKTICTQFGYFFRKVWGIESHTHYWDKSFNSSPTSLKELRKILEISQTNEEP